MEIFTFNLPDIGEGVVEGEVIQWLKNVGDAVKQDEPVVIVMTDKATVELPSPYPGVLEKQYYQPGQIAIKDKPLYDIRLSSPQMSLDKENLIQEPVKKTVEKPSVVKEKVHGKALATPKVRHLAQELGVDIANITGSGKDGRVTAEDLKHTFKHRDHTEHLALDGDEEELLIGIRGLMARKMDQTRIPQFSYFEQAEVTRLIQMRKNLKGKADAEGIA